MIKVLMIIPSLNRNSGVSRFAYNTHCAVNRDQVSIDFLHQRLGNPAIKTFDEEIERSGSAVYEVEDPGRDIFRFMRDVRAFMDEHGREYDIVHCNVPNAAWCYLGEAKRVGIKHRILHGHSNKSSDILLHRLRNAPLRRMSNLFATERFACSQEAGVYQFGARSFHIIRNGIPIQRYAFDQGYRARHRAALGIPEDALVVGCVGRLVPAKNYRFVLEVFQSVVTQDPSAYLVIVGDGPERDSVEERVTALELDGRVLMLGSRDDVNELYSAFDVFLMPSLTEGLPFAAVEAQASGLRCLFSNNVPSDSDITVKNAFLPLDADKTIWSSNALELSGMGRYWECEKALADRGYSAYRNAEELSMLYKAMLRGKAAM